MKKQHLLSNAISTLLHSFGSEAPEEVYWGLNEMSEWLTEETDIEIPELVHPYNETGSDTEGPWMVKVLEAFEQLNRN